MLSGLTCTCMQMQTTIESSETTEAEKREIILQHLKSSQTYRNTDPFPEFNPGDLSHPLYKNIYILKIQWFHYVS